MKRFIIFGILLLASLVILGCTDSSEENYECPDMEYIDCMPIVPPEKQKYCSGPYAEWVTENCNVSMVV